MQTELFNKTTIGADYVKNGQYYPVDLLLDYLYGLLRMKDEHEVNAIWKIKYENEISAVKEILVNQTAA
ncbi:MAG: hypothetical protein WKF89_01125 [Chitinophagaceae bacterium]